MHRGREQQKEEAPERVGVEPCEVGDRRYGAGEHLLEGDAGQQKGHVEREPVLDLLPRHGPRERDARRDAEEEQHVIEDVKERVALVQEHDLHLVVVRYDAVERRALEPAVLGRAVVQGTKVGKLEAGRLYAHGARAIIHLGHLPHPGALPGLVVPIPSVLSAALREVWERLEFEPHRRILHAHDDIEVLNIEREGVQVVSFEDVHVERPIAGDLDDGRALLLRLGDKALVLNVGLRGRGHDHAREPLGLPVSVQAVATLLHRLLSVL
eukprot:2771750-Prymnesium_polylepis.2